MSTFYGGPQLVSVSQINIQRSTNGQSAGSYTVPSGHFAIISFLTSFSGNTAEGGYQFTIGAAFFSTYSSQTGVLQGSGLVLTQGGVVAVNLSVTQNNQVQIGIHIGIQVFKNP
jgi:hypothetical protein